jgi:hypothetical protein
MLIRNIPTRAEGAYFLSLVDFEIRIPCILLFFSVFSTTAMVALDTYSRAFKLDLIDLPWDQQRTNFTDPADGRTTPSLVAGGDYMIAAWVVEILFWASAFFLWLLMVLHKLLHARRIFNGEISERASEACNSMQTTTDTPWFSTPSAATLRRHLAAYVGEFQSRGKLGNAISPEHFLEYTLRQERAKGHGDLSFLSRYMIEQIFQEWTQEQLTSQSVMIDRGDELVGHSGAQSAEISAATLASASPGDQDYFTRI